MQSPLSPIESQVAQPDVQAPASAIAQSAVLRSQAALLSRLDLAQAATALAVELAELLACERVSIGLLQDGQVSIVATSQAPEMDARLGAAAAIIAAMHEALDQRTSVASPQGDSAAPPVTLAHHLLAGTGGRAGAAACSVLLHDASGTVGVLTVERSSGAFRPDDVALLEDVAGFAGPVLELKRRDGLGWWQRLRGVGRGLLKPRSGWRMAAVGLAAVVVATLLLVPVTWRVSAPARLEGSVQRAIVASTDGFLQQANVRAGDQVKEGQVLAELAAQDLELERRRRDSELRQHENAYRAAFARNDRAQMVISQSRAGEAQAMLDLVQGQLDRARIVAPFDGVVIKGDLSQTLGAPVQRGEVLLTLAPNESFRLIVEVDESDIAAVRPGQPGQLALAAQPDRLLGFVTRRVIPVAATGDSRNYFEVEATFDRAEANLRPGLSGVAKIEVGKRSITWLLTHRLVDWLRLAFWTLGW